MDIIKDRRSIRKYKPDEIERKLIEEIIYSASLAPSAKNRQPWKFIVSQGKEKDKLVDVMRHGINSEKTTHELMPEWAFAIPDAENTVRIMQEVPCLIAVLNTNQHTPFASIENEKRIVEICDSLSIGAAIENMILTAKPSKRDIRIIEKPDYCTIEEAEEHFKDHQYGVFKKEVADVVIKELEMIQNKYDEIKAKLGL